MSEFPLHIGRYELVEEVGSGGFATVYRAVDTRLEREVALKLMRPLLMSDPSFVKRFQRGAKTAAAFDHANIVPILDYGESENRLFLVMKFMDGGSLEDLLGEGPLAWERTVQIVEAIAAALDYAHGNGVVHRDVKPGNVLLSQDGRVMLGDFGVIKALERGTLTATLSGGILGTPAYIAPEIWNEREVTAASDIYSLACLAFEMVTGDQLFEASTPPATMALHFRPPQFPGRWPSGTPPGLERVLRRGLAQEPTDRYESAGEFARALSALAADPLAKPYAELQSALGAGEWDEAVALGERIVDQDPDYRDVPNLLTQATERKVEGEREAWVTRWRKEAEAAIEDEDAATALAAAKKWQRMAPDDQAAQAALERARALAKVAPEREEAHEEAPASKLTVLRDSLRRLPRWAYVVAGLGAVAIILFLVFDGGPVGFKMEEAIDELEDTPAAEDTEVAPTEDGIEDDAADEVPVEAEAEVRASDEEPAPELAEEQAAEGQTIYLMGADGLLSDTFFDNVGEAGLGMLFSGPLLPSGDSYDRLVQSYREAYGENPIQSFHSHAYDATTMALNAIQQVVEEQADGSLVIDRQALIEAMYGMERTGITGVLACNEFGDCASPNIGIFRFDDASWGASQVLNNVQQSYQFENPEQGRDVVPGAPADLELDQVTVAAGAPIEVATLQAISGAVTNLGTDQVRAVELAIEDFGEIAGHPVQLSMEEDGLCNAEGGQLGAQRIVANPQVVAIIGTSCSSAAVPATEVTSGAGYLIISASNTAPALTATGYFSEEGPSRGDNWSYGYFRTAHNDEFQGRGAATFAVEELGLSQVATINDGDPYTQGLTSAMGSSFEGLGGEVALATAVGKEEEDMRPVLTDVAASGAELVYFPIFEPAGRFIVLQAQEVGIKIQRR